MFDTINALMGSATSSILILIGVIVLWFIAKTIISSNFALGAVLVIILLGGFVLWAVANISVISNKIGEEVNPASAAAVVEHLDPQDGARAGTGARA